MHRPTRRTIVHCSTAMPWMRTMPCHRNRWCQRAGHWCARCCRSEVARYMRPAGRTLCARKNVQNRPQMPRAARCCRTAMAKMWTTPCYRNRRRRRVGHYCARRRRAEAPRSMRRAGRTHCVCYFVANSPQMARATSRAIERCCCTMMRMSTTPSLRDRRRRRECRYCCG